MCIGTAIHAKSTSKQEGAKNLQKTSFSCAISWEEEPHLNYNLISLTWSHGIDTRNACVKMGSINSLTGNFSTASKRVFGGITPCQRKECSSWKKNTCEVAI